MNNIETMKLARDQLDNCWYYANECSHMATQEDCDNIKKTIAALDQAIEQAQQAEPAAWMNGVGDLFKNPDEAQRGQTMRPLYASPPPRQPEPVIDKSAAIRIATALGWTPPRQPLTDEQINLVREMRDVQGYDGNWNYDPYMQGLYNGLEFAVSLLEKREPVFRDAPEQWLGDVSKKRDNFNIVGSKTAAHGIKGEA